jgi:NAD-dependent deacetylase
LTIGYGQRMTSGSAPPLDVTSELATLWRQSARVVIFSGAGMSTESGLPDFRSAGGLWRQNQRFEELASVDGLRRTPAEFRAFYRGRIEALSKHKPHRGHEVIAELEARGRVHSVITQNVDGFHEAAGSQRVLRLHGSLRSIRCHDCGKQAPMMAFVTASGGTCECGGSMRPNVVLFGESLDAEVLEQAVRVSRDCDLFIVLGSSLRVSPANSLPALALGAGARLVIINEEPTPFDSRAQFVVRSRIGPLLASLDGALRSPDAPE